MKIKLLIILSIAIVFTAAAQPFEGKIIYSAKFKSKIPEMEDEQWNAMMGTSQEYFIKDGNYKTVSNGTIFNWQLYINKDNKIYNKLSTDEKVFWIDCSTQSDAILKIKFTKGAAEILEHLCDELILTCKSGVHKYYFNSAIAADAAIFKNHKYRNWFDYLSKSHALPLKSIIESDKFIVETTAIKIIPLDLDANVFQIPKGMNTEKSP